MLYNEDELEYGLCFQFRVAIIFVVFLLKISEIFASSDIFLWHADIFRDRCVAGEITFVWKVWFDSMPQFFNVRYKPRIQLRKLLLLRLSPKLSAKTSFTSFWNTQVFAKCDFSLNVLYLIFSFPLFSTLCYVVMNRLVLPSKIFLLMVHVTK